MTLLESNASDMNRIVKSLKEQNESLQKELDHLHKIFTYVDCALFKFIRRREDSFEFTFLSGDTALCNGLEAEHFVGKSPDEIFDSETAVFLNEHYRRAFTGEKVSYEVTFKDCIYSVILSPVTIEGVTTEVVGTAIDITERKQMEKRAAETHEKFAAVFDGALDAILLFDDHGVPIEANPAASRLLGFSIEELKRAEHFAFLDPAFQQQIPLLLEKLKAEGTLMGESKIPSKQGIVCEVEHVTKANVLPNMHLTILRDITKRKKLEESVRKAATLNVIGELAAGIGHEIRNPMTSVKGFIQLLKENPTNTGYFDVVLEELKQIETVISEWMLLSKPQAFKMTEESLEELITESIIFMEPEAMRNGTVIYLEAEGNLPTILCERNQMKQVFVNLIKNGLEAMESGGNIYIRLQRNALSSVKIEVEDEGCGIAPERIDSLGEPFYMTEEKGTGLGLMISYKIIQNHKGIIDVKSTLDKGTTFTITLPC